MLNSDSLNSRYRFIRRAIINYYTKCSQDETLYDNLPGCSFEDIMSFFTQVMYCYLQDEYKGILK